MPEEFARRHVADRDQVFGHSLGLVATALGLATDGFETTTGFATCLQNTKLRSSTIPAGSVGAQRVAVIRHRAQRLVNVIPAVVAARPGIVPTTKLAMPVARLGD